MDREGGRTPKAEAKKEVPRKEREKQKEKEKGKEKGGAQEWELQEAGRKEFERADATLLPFVQGAIGKPQAIWTQLALNDKPPLPRWGHTSSLCGSKMYIFGGTGNKVLGDCYVFDLEQNSWGVVTSSGEAPGPRFGHSACSVPSLPKEVMVFGGRGMGNKHHNDLHIFNPDTGVWRRVAPDRNSPEARAGHTLTAVVSGKVVLFGGHTKSNKFFDNLYVLACSKDAMTWTRHKGEGDAPTARSGHSAVAYGNHLYIFGGYDSRKYYNDVHVLDVDTLVWRKATTNGTPPAPRSGHSCTLVGNNLVIFGGCANSTFLNDVHILNLDMMSWVQPSVAGQPSRPRFRHTATLVGRSQLYIFGGSGSGILFNDLAVLETSGLVKLQTNSPTLRTSGTPSQSAPPAPQLIGATVRPTEGNTTVDGLPSNIHVMQMFLSASMALKAERQQREQAEDALAELRAALAGEQKAREKIEARRALVEGELMLEQEAHGKLEATRTKMEKELRKEQKKRRKLEEERRRLEETITKLEARLRLTEEQQSLQETYCREQDSRKKSTERRTKEKDRATREKEHKKKFGDRVELEALVSENATLKNKIHQQEVELLRLVDERSRFNEVKSSELAPYETVDFERLSMQECLRLEEHYLSCLKSVGVAKQKQLQLQVEELQRAKAMLEDQKLCSICCDRDICVVLLPCGHRCLCKSCGDALEKCPICRKAIAQRINTY